MIRRSELLHALEWLGVPVEEMRVVEIVITLDAVIITHHSKDKDGNSFAVGDELALDQTTYQIDRES